MAKPETKQQILARLEKIDAERKRYKSVVEDERKQHTEVVRTVKYELSQVENRLKKTVKYSEDRNKTIRDIRHAIDTFVATNSPGAFDDKGKYDVNTGVFIYDADSGDPVTRLLRYLYRMTEDIPF